MFSLFIGNPLPLGVCSDLEQFWWPGDEKSGMAEQLFLPPLECLC